MFIIVLAVVAIICTYMIGKKIFLLLNIIKFSLIGTLLCTLFIYFENWYNIYIYAVQIKYIFLVNIILIVYFYIIGLIWDKNKRRQFYMTLSHRENFLGTFVLFPIIFYIIFISYMITYILQIAEFYI